jgi:archaellum biogenesis ATPase FlaH
MKKYANHMILPNLRLILECCKGQASVDDAIDMKKNELSDKLYDPNYNVIVDFREFDSFINSSNIDSISNYINFLKQFEIKSKVALLTTKPHQVILSHILKELSIKSLAINFEIFSTLEAAIRFLNYLPENYDVINKSIIELNKNTA